MRVNEGARWLASFPFGVGRRLEVSVAEPLVVPFILRFVLRDRLIVAQSIRRVSRGNVFGDFARCTRSVSPTMAPFRCSAGCDPRFRMSLNGRRTRFCLKDASRLILICSGKSA